MHVDSDVDALRLQTTLRDLVALSAIPAAWIRSEPPAVAAGLADSLVALLQLDFAFARLSYPDGSGAVEVTRGSGWKRFPEWLEGHTTRVQLPGKAVVADVGEDSDPCRGVAIPIGVDGDRGLVAAASRRSGFPSAADEMLLSFAANQGATAFQNAHLIRERKQAEKALRKAHNELEVKVADRTAELEQLAREQAALRRVATLVAQGMPPGDIFAAVSDEVARLFGSAAAAVARFDYDDPAIVSVGVSKTIQGVVAVGTRWSVDERWASAEVYRTGRAARVDASDWLAIGGLVGAAVRRLDVVSTAASPINVEGRLWGAFGVSSSEPLPFGTEERLESFSELVATAITNAESREALRMLADEQAALRRVATLVVQGVQPAEIFAAVTEEVGRLFGTEAATVGRFEPPELVAVGVGKSLQEQVPVGSRWPFDDALASTHVFRTGRSVRVDRRNLSSATEPVAEVLRRLGLVSTVASPIIVDGNLWGAITISTKEEPLPLDAEDRLQQFCDIVATAIANAQSRSELAASRARVVAAADETRRQVERNLHDGVQQRLVSLALKARKTAASDSSPPIKSAFSEFAGEIDSTIDDVREIARGIHPPILSEAGLEYALRALARRSAAPVALELDFDASPSEPVGVAAYYIVSEALTNAAKHAAASAVDVRVESRDGHLSLEIRDDGVGGADPNGSGLLGLKDRVEALNGTISLVSPAGAGTTLRVQLPAESKRGQGSD